MVAHDTIVERERTDRFAAVTPHPRRRPGGDQLRGRVQQALTWSSQGTWRPAGAGFVAGALAVGLVATVVRPTISAPAPVHAAALPRPPPSLAAEPRPAAAAVSRRPNRSGAATPEPVAAPSPVATAEPVAEALALARHQDLGDGVALVSDGAGIRLTVAFTGSGKGAEQFRMADPSASP